MTTAKETLPIGKVHVKQYPRGYTQSQSKQKGEGEAGVVERNAFYPGAIPLRTKVTSILAQNYEAIRKQIFRNG